MFVTGEGNKISLKDMTHLPSTGAHSRGFGISISVSSTGARRNHECYRWRSSGYDQRRRAGRHSGDRQP